MLAASQLSGEGPLMWMMLLHLHVNSLPPGKFFMLFCLLIFTKSTFLKNSFRNTIRVSNSLDQDQA